MNKQSNIFKDIIFVFPVMGYYLLEAAIVGFFVFLVWTIFLKNTLGHIGYVQVVAIYWIIKMLLFDVFKLIAGFTSMGKNMKNEMHENEKNDSYNEQHSE